ncbi:MAG TPA: TolC family protein [Ohtaekwangia sp.]|uniref:TolC family protein n=1 Tax=Ohtaekwangia sp. TaxID=2066019 RepID=UPI002F952EF0
MKSQHIKSIYIPVVLLALLLTSGAQAQQQQLSLENAITLAKSSNPEILVSTLEVEKAKQQRVVSRSLLLPTVNATAAANHYFQLPAFFGFGETTEGGKVPYGRFGGKDQLAAAVTAVQPLYNPQAYPTLRRSHLQESESEANASSKQIEVLAAVKQTYLTILVLEQRIKLQQESITRNKRVLQDARSLFAQGKALRVDTLRAFTSVKNLEPALTQLLYAVETQTLQLKTYIGLDSLQEVSLTDSLTVPAPETIPDEATVYTNARQNNPEFKALSLREDIGRESVKVASGLRKPVVAAVAQYQVQSQTNRFEYGQAYYPTSSYVGLQVTVPLFAGFNNQAKVKQAAYTQQQATLVKRHAEDQLHAQVHDVIARSQESVERLRTTAVVRETAQVSYTIIQYRYKNGIASRLELTDAELALSTAQANYLEAVYDYLTARIQLDKLMGVVL